MYCQYTQTESATIFRYTLLFLFTLKKEFPMALSASLENRIRSEMAALAPSDFRKADSSIPTYIDFLSSFLQQQKRIKPRLLLQGYRLTSRSIIRDYLKSPREHSVSVMV
jgi:hypothetical protein